jgi:hypothetical protein
MATPARQRILDAALNLIQNGGDRAGHTREIPWTRLRVGRTGAVAGPELVREAAWSEGREAAWSEGKEPLWQSSRTRQRRE